MQRALADAHSLARREPVLFVLATAALAVPLWVCHWIPTQDGPSHLYNGQILLELLRVEGSFYADYYQTNRTALSLPNWFSHSVLATLMLAFEPLTAEKIEALLDVQSRADARNGTAVR